MWPWSALLPASVTGFVSRKTTVRDARTVLAGEEAEQTPFYAAGVPVLHFFTGAHDDYHKPSDEYDPNWDLSGAAQEVMLLRAMGATLANNRDFPNWREGVEFKAKRDKWLRDRTDAWNGNLPYLDI